MPAGGGAPIVSNNFLTGYPLVGTTNLNAAGVSPANGTTYYFPVGGAAGWLTSAGVFRVPCPRAGRIRSCSVRDLVGATNGSGESNTYQLVVNGGTPTVLDSAVTFSHGINSYQIKNYTGLSIAVSQGDYVDFSIICPTFATRPTGMFIIVTLFIELL